MIDYLKITCYTYNKRECKVKHATIEDFEKEISEISNDGSIFEYLTKGTPTRIYFDIENIPNDDRTTFENIVGDLKTFIAKTSGIEIGDYCLTKNEGSRHPGQSYHLIFSEYYISNYCDILNLLSQFIKEFPHYKQFIDSSVYSKKRLFRSINQIGVNKRKDEEPRPNTDIHKIVKGTIKDSILQNVDGLKEFTHEYEFEKSAGLKQISNNTMFEKQNKQQNNQPNITVNIQMSDIIEKFLPLKREEKKIIDVNEILGKLEALKITSSSRNIRKWCKKELKYYRKNNKFDMPIEMVNATLCNLK